VIGGEAIAFSAQAHIDDLRGMGIGRHARNRESGSPRDPVENVGIVAAALAEHPYWQNLRRPVDAGDPHAVVRVGADNSHHAHPVPVARLSVAILKIRIVLVKRIDPITRISRVGVAAVTVVRDLRVSDEVVTGQHPAGQVFVRSIAGVDDRDGDPGRAGGGVPSADRVDGKRIAPQIPLSRVAAIVRRARGVSAEVGLDVFDVGTLGEACGQHLCGTAGEPAVERHHLCPLRHGTKRDEVYAVARGGRLQAGEPRRREGGVRLRLHARAVAQLDDEPRGCRLRPRLRDSVARAKHEDDRRDEAEKGGVHKKLRRTTPEWPRPDH